MNSGLERLSLAPFWKMAPQPLPNWQIGLELPQLEFVGT
jgi:hypothetical protein